LGIRVKGTGKGFGVLGFGFWVLDFGFRVLGFGFWVLGFGFWVLGFGFWVLGFGFRVSGFASRVSGFGLWMSGVAVFITCVSYDSARPPWSANLVMAWRHPARRARWWSYAWTGGGRSWSTPSWTSRGCVTKHPAARTFAHSSVMWYLLICVVFSFRHSIMTGVNHCQVRIFTFLRERLFPG